MEEHTMKLKRLGSLGLALALTLSLAVLPAHAAASFPDIENHWAREYIEDMKAKGYAAGSTDGNFYPEMNMNATESLLFCARVTGIAEETRDAIYDGLHEDVTAVLHESVAAWGATAIRELCVAVESGILSLAELEALSKTDPSFPEYAGKARPYLLWNITRENVCMYLVRAMQLEPMARATDDELCLSYLRSHYADADEIAPALRPYVYILSYYKVFSGLDKGGVRIANPKGAIKRGEMTVLMSQALQVMDKLGISPELSEYTTYPWVAGRIASVTTELDGGVSLTLESDISGTQTCQLPVNVTIYDSNNILADTSFLRNGKYIRVNLDEEGVAQSVRIGGTLTLHEGAISSLDGNKLVLLENGATRTYTMDRFTEVAAGDLTGDRTVIDPEAGYTSATCYVDEVGHLAGISLWGGTAKVQGLISELNLAADGSATLTLAAPNGVTSTYGIPAGTTVRVNGAAGSLNLSHVRYQAVLRISKDRDQVTAVDVDTLTVYRQGRVVRQNVTGGTRNVVIADAMDRNREVTIPIAEDAVITYGGEQRTSAQIENDWYVTARLTGGIITKMEAYPASVSTEGTLAAITYGTTTLLTLTRADGSTAAYELDINALPSITRGGKKATLFQLRTGDSLVVTLRYNKVDKIEATPRQPDLTGTVSGFSTDSAGSTLVVTLSNGESRTFTVGVGVSVTKNGNAATFRDINRGDTVALITNGDEALSIDITATASLANKLTGTVLLTTNAGNTRSVTILSDDRPDPVTVDLRANSAKIIDRNGNSLTLNSLKPEDLVEIHGSFKGSDFVATLVIKY